MSVRALFHTAPRRVEIRELPALHAAPGEVVVQTVCSGISGGTERLPELPLDELCTHVFPFPNAADAFRAVDDNTPGLMHAVLDYDGESHDDARMD